MKKKEKRKTLRFGRSRTAANDYYLVPFVVILAALFYVIDPFVLLQNLGYATIVILSLYELKEKVRELLGLRR
jgi:hypothetical protein